MGGRDYARICELTGSDPAQPVTLEQVQATVDSGILALPDFSGGSGPCAGRAGRITGQPAHGAALATLYLALMIELELELLDAPGAVLLEGAFAANPLLCAVLATLCAQPVYVSGATDATALGAAILCDWHREPESAPRERCEPCAVRALEAYRARWRDGLASADRAVPGTRKAIGAERE
jgi:sugar (pentulose or hexulose) kinase